MFERTEIWLAYMKRLGPIFLGYFAIPGFIVWVGLLLGLSADFITADQAYAFLAKYAPFAIAIIAIYAGGQTTVAICRDNHKTVEAAEVKVKEIQDRRILKEEICLKLTKFILEGEGLCDDLKRQKSKTPQDDYTKTVERAATYIMKRLNKSYLSELTDVTDVEPMPFADLPSAPHRNTERATRAYILALRRIKREIMQTTWDGRIMTQSNPETPTGPSQ